MSKPINYGLRSYWDLGNKIELHYPGTIVSYHDPEDLAMLRRWSREAFALYTRNQEQFNSCNMYQEDVRLGYVEYMISIGQFDE